MGGKPAQARNAARIAAGAAFPVMGLFQIVVDADPQLQAIAEAGAEVEKRGFYRWAHHGLHGIGEDQHLMPARERVLRHGAHIRVHEGLAPGKGDFRRAELQCLDLVEIARRLVARDVGKPVLGRAGMNVAMRAFDIAERARVDPQRLQPSETDRGAALLLGRHIRMGKFLAGQIVGFHSHASETSAVRRNGNSQICEAGYALRPERRGIRCSMK